MNFKIRYSKLIFLCSYFLSLNPGTSGTATIVPMQPFNLQDVTNKMVEAIKKNDGKRTDVNAILSKLVYWQRMQLADAYEEATGGSNLIDDIKKDIDQDNYKRLIDSMFSSELEIYVNDISRAFDGLGTTEKAVIEISVKITGSKEMKKAFRNLYRKFHKLEPIEQGIKRETSDDFKHVLYEILSPYRHREPPPQYTDEKLAESTAKILKEKLGDLKDNRKEIDTFLIQTNFPQLHLTLDKFKSINNEKTLEKELQERLKGDKENAYVDLCHYDTNFVSYVATRLRESFKSDDLAVIRNIVIESERDLVEVKAKFFEYNNETLYKKISDTTDGIYKDLLLLIIGPEK